MHTQNLAETAGRVLRSLPVKVVFAGFQSDTLNLARAGWEFSMQQHYDPMFGGFMMRMAMRFGDRDTGLHAITHPVNLEWEHKRAFSEPEFLKEFCKSMVFHVAVMHPNLHFRHVTTEFGQSQGFASSFMPIDPVPQFVEETSIKDFKFFKVANPTVKDLIVDPKDVPELLDLVLKAQKPMLEGVRARERSRDNERWMREGMPVKPAHTVQAQIITLAG